MDPDHDPDSCDGGCGQLHDLFGPLPGELADITALMHAVRSGDTVAVNVLVAGLLFDTDPPARLFPRLARRPTKATTAWCSSGHSTG